MISIERFELITFRKNEFQSTHDYCCSFHLYGCWLCYPCRDICLQRSVMLRYPAILQPTAGLATSGRAWVLSMLRPLKWEELKFTLSIQVQLSVVYMMSIRLYFKLCLDFEWYIYYKNKDSQRRMSHDEDRRSLVAFVIKVRDRIKKGRR